MDTQDFKEIAILGVVMVGVLIVIGLVIGIPAYLVDKAQCNRIASDSNINTEYRLIGGCYVEVNGRMIPKDNWRGESEQ